MLEMPTRHDEQTQKEDQLISQPQPSSPRFACPEPGCDRVFESAQGLGRHRSSAHGSKTSKKKRRVPIKSESKQLTSPIFREDKILREIYPSGNIPVSAMGATIEWINKGRELFEKAVKV